MWGTNNHREIGESFLGECHAHHSPWIKPKLQQIRLGIIHGVLTHFECKSYHLNKKKKLDLLHLECYPKTSEI